MADIFISYTASDREWAFWIGHELEKLGHTPRICEWEVSGGGDVVAWVEERYQTADHILFVISKEYLTKSYSGLELQRLAAATRPIFMLPVFIEACKAPLMLSHVTRCNLEGLSEDDARARLAAFLAPAGKPSGPIRYPGGAKPSESEPIAREVTAFPGQQTEPSEAGPSVEPSPRNASKNQIVILVHGIRDFALWQDSIRSTLEDAGFAVEAINYGRFNLVEFLLPFSYFRNRAVATVWRQIRIVRQNNPQARISVVAHSFGTFVISHLMKENFDIEFYRIVFCGSVVAYDFEFEQIQNRFSPPILNEVGTRDVWPAIADSVTWGYGSAGTYGFRRPLVRDRWHNKARHGYFLDRVFCQRFWVPFLKEGQIIPNAEVPERPRAWLQTLSIFKIKYLLGILVILFAVFLYRAGAFVRAPAPPKNAEVVISPTRPSPEIPPDRLLSAAPFRVTLNDCTGRTCDVELYLRGYDSRGRLRYDAKQRFQEWIINQFRDTSFNTIDRMYFAAKETIKFQSYCRLGQGSLIRGETRILDWQAWNEEGTQAYSVWLNCGDSTFNAGIGIGVNTATERVNEPAVKTVFDPLN